MAQVPESAMQYVNPEQKTGSDSRIAPCFFVWKISFRYTMISIYKLYYMTKTYCRYFASDRNF